MDKGTDQDHQLYMGNPVTSPERLQDFLASNDEPYFPQGIILPVDLNNDFDPHFTTSRSPEQHSTFTDLVSTTTSSDCLTWSTDSVFGGNCTFQDSPCTSSPGNLALRNYSSTNSVETLPRTTAHKYYCHHCGVSVPSQSQLKKHIQRHSRPFKCPYPNCPKGRKGFSTPNDLVRHKRSVHEEYHLPGRSFICSHCVSNGKDRKIWSRADNFRSHLARAHDLKLSADKDLSAYQYTPQVRKTNSIDPSDLIGLLEPSDTHSYSALSSATQIHLPICGSLPVNIAPHVGTSRLTDFENVTHNVGGGHAAGALLENNFPNLMKARSSLVIELDSTMDNHLGPHFDNHHFLDQSNLFDQEMMQHGNFNDLESSSIVDMRACGRSERETDRVDLQDLDEHLYDRSEADVDKAAKDISNGSSQNLPSSGILNYLKCLPRDLLLSALGNNEQVTKTSSESLNFHAEEGAFITCPMQQCDKAFGRPCELKKHLKRHQKPYGCTFRGCQKAFGSKNDWKRHEISQHYPLIFEQTAFKSSSGVIIGRSPLSPDQRGCERKLKEKRALCQPGRLWTCSFWCGFCGQVIDCGSGANIGTLVAARFDHIDDHVFGKHGRQRRNMSEWRHLEGKHGGIFFREMGSDEEPSMLAIEVGNSHGEE